MRVDLYGDGIGYVTDEHTSIRPCEANLSHENRVRFVMEQAIVSRNYDPTEYYDRESVRYETITHTHPLYPDFNVSRIDTTKTPIGNPWVVIVNPDGTETILARFEKNFTTLGYINSNYGYWDETLSNENVQYQYRRTDEECDAILFKKMEKTFHRLMKEAAPNLLGDKASPSRPLEFCPVQFNIEVEDNEVCLYPMKDKNSMFPIWRGHTINFFNEFQFGSYVIDDILFTNLRTCLNAEIPYDKVPFSDSKGFIAVRAKLPMFVWSQVMTHTRISKESQSDRVSTETDYWLPMDLEQRIKEAHQRDGLDSPHLDLVLQIMTYGQLTSEDKDFRGFILECLLNIPSQNEVEAYFKYLRYKKEIYQRAMYYMKYKTMIMTGWVQDPSSWSHFLLEREAYPEHHKSWVQDETRILANAMKDIVLDHVGLIS